ncbi:unnamed protein product [Bathycoccus prasinos]
MRENKRRRRRSAEASSSSSSFVVPDVANDDDEDADELTKTKTTRLYCLLTACFAERCRKEYHQNANKRAVFEHTVDFGLSRSKIRIDETHVEISKRQQSDDDDDDDDAIIVLNREDVFAIEPDDLTVYTVVQTSEDAGDSRALAKLEPCRIYSNIIDRVCALCPSDSVNPELAPTALIAGFSMHRFGLGVDPKEDTRRKIASLKPYKGNNLAVLDVCTGLAYTAIMASELENVSSVTTIELDPTMTQICAMNPHSKGLFGRAKNTTKKRSEDGGEDYEKNNIISQLYGNAFDVIQTLPDRAFDRIIHDPPTFALAGELYGEKFYSELFRVLKPSGRVYHYTGDPSSNVAGGGGVRGIVKRMKLVGFESVEIDHHAHGVVAAKQPNVKFFSSERPEKKKAKREKKPLNEIASNLFTALKPVRLRDDDSEAAQELKAILELARSRTDENGDGDENGVRERIRAEAKKKVGSTVAKYWKAKFKEFGESEAVKDAAPLTGSAVNVAVTGLVLRIFLPRLAALNAVGGFDELAEFFGIPPREDLIGYLDQINGQPMIAIFGIYVLLFFAEKVTMTDEFLPIGFVLPVLSPMVFGNVLNGTVLTSLASTIAASANFWLGRTVLREKALNFKWFSKDGEPTRERKWYQALDRRFNSENYPDQFVPEGFKSALLLRLCPILPIPISGNWYVCGVTKLKYWEFFAAHFIGSSKTAFIDAYLGSIILRTILSPEVDGVTGAVKEQAKNAVIFETCALLGVSILVSTYATQLFTDILDEEGVDADSFGFGNKEEEEEKQETTTNTFAFVGAAAASTDNDEDEGTSSPEAAETEENKKLNRALPGESFDLMSTDEDGEVFINAGDYLSRQRALESGDFDALADMDQAFEKLSEVDDMGPDM